MFAFIAQKPEHSNDQQNFISQIKRLIIHACFFCLCSLNTVYHTAHADSSTAEHAAEYAVKAAYIFNILRFVSWPEDHPLANTETLDICLLYDNPFSDYLKPIVHKTISGKAITLRTISRQREVNSCHLVFINNRSSLGDRLISQQPENTILLGNDIDFIEQGGLFGFYIKDNKVRLGANRDALKNSKLKISSLLIEVCQLFGGGS